MTKDCAADFHEILNALLEKPREQGERHAVLIIRIAGFQRLRGVYSYRWCDKLNQDIDAALRSLVPAKDSLCPMQQGEYGLIITHVKDKAIVELAGAKIRSFLEKALKKHEARVALHVVVGAAIIPERALPAEDVLIAAHAAALEAEAANCNFMIHEVQDRSEALTDTYVESELIHAVALNQFELWLQPQLDIHTLSVQSAEALIRWKLPRVGYVSPEIFIPIAERCAIINQITEWVVHNAARVTRSLRDRGLEFTTSVNVSGGDVVRPGLLDVLSEIVGLWDLSPENLTLELTESEMLRNPGYAKTVLQQCSDLGFRIAIDDFGTGYSSLSYLRQLPFNELKIDKSFIVNLLHNEKDQQIVRTILSLAENFGVEVVAEGVEDEETVSFLRDLGCARIQGYWLSKPLPEDEFAEFLVGAGIAF